MGIFINNQNALVKSNMISYINPFNAIATERVAAYSQNFISAGYSPEDATHAAYQLIDLSLSRQQQLVSYDNAYMYVGMAILVCIPIILLIRKKKIDSIEPHL
jgi:DHA2 family multidrug resistance protein